MTELLSDAEIARRVESIRDHVTTRIPVERARRKKRAWVVSGVVAAAVAVAGAALVIRASDDVIKYEVRCYESASLESDYGQMKSDLWVGENGDSGRGEVDPAVNCGDLWRMGLVGQPTPPANPNTANFEVPELVGCELANGMAAGFPRGDSTASATEFCNELGLAPCE